MLSADDVMAEYQYTPIADPTTHVRLLLLSPPRSGVRGLQGCLLEYHIRDSNSRSRPYEALSYVWGTENKTETITLDGRDLAITQSLHDLLLRLQDSVCAQTFWVDGICINQENEEEKEAQIPLMAEIYAKAKRVIAWLGHAEYDSCEALNTIRRAGRSASAALIDGTHKTAVQNLLRRPWFQRIWILQEVAAARQLLITCGPTEIDGYAFCAGLARMEDESLGIPHEMLFLIQGAIFRTRHVSRRHGGLSLATCSLGTLIDMYHTYGASKPHDKVYALLGMCSDNIDNAGLEPNYKLPWELLVQRLVTFLLGPFPQVSSGASRNAVMIRSKAQVFGRISRIHNEGRSNGRQELKVLFDVGLNVSGQPRELELRCFSQVSTNPVLVGDVVCVLKGSLKFTIARLCKDHLMVIMLAVEVSEPLDYFNKISTLSNGNGSCDRDLLLYWDWAVFRRPETVDSISLTNRAEGSLFPPSEVCLSSASIIWDFGLILADLQEYAMAENALFEATRIHEGEHAEESLAVSKTRVTASPILYHAIARHHRAVVELLFRIEHLDLSKYDSKHATPLVHATREGQDDIVAFLIASQANININKSDATGQSALSCAAARGAERIAEMLLARHEKLGLPGQIFRTSFYNAARNGHQNVLKLLLKQGTPDVVSAFNGRSLLSYAAEYGHEEAVGLLLATPGIDINSKEKCDRTPLSWAAEWGHDGVVRQLLETGRARVQWKPLRCASCCPCDKRVPLSYAAAYGHEGAMKLLLTLGQADPDRVNSCERGPLSYAAEKGKLGAVALLLSTGKVKVMRRDCKGHTPFDRAISNGHTAVAELLKSHKSRSFLGKIIKKSEHVQGRAKHETGHDSALH